MKYKAIVSDFDGTLVGGSLFINESVKEKIRDYVKNGGIFSIATGRDYFGALKDICIDLGIESFHIIRGGSEIVSSKTHEVVWGQYIDPKMLEKLLAFFHSKDNIFFAAERGKIIYTKDGLSHEMFGPKAEFGVLQNIPTDSVPKVFLPASKNMPEVVLQLIEEIKEKFPELNVIKTSHKEFLGLDVNDGGVSKHLALLEYSKLSNLKPSEIVGVGDSYNDYPLLSACGYKVAMGNAPKELIEIADKVVGTQENDGIIEVLDFIE